MLNLTSLKITAANGGGYLIRPKTGERMFCMIPDLRNLGELEMTHINVNIFDDMMTFVIKDGELYEICGDEGTKIITRFLRVTDVN